MKTLVEDLSKGYYPLVRTLLRCTVIVGLVSACCGALAEAISDTALQQISALRAEKESRSPAQRKMDSQLVYALKRGLNQAIAPGVGNLRTLVKPDAKGRVEVDLKASVTPELLDFIQNSGGTIISGVPQFQAVRALVPLSLTEALANRGDVRFVGNAVPCMTRTGSVDSEGDTTHRALSARPAFNVSGAGVKVGVLSDSVDYLSQAVASGDLPANVTVLPGQAGVGAGEGTAMMEIVYDLAPGAQLFFATGFNGEAQFAQNILNLRAAGCDIIVDDIGYFDESPFQDGIVARAVNSVTAEGALYFSAAGNEGSLKHGTSGTWEGDFADGGAAGPPVNGKGGTLHSFGATAYDTVTGIGSATVLHWSDPLGASTNDYDLFVLDSSGSTVVSSSTTVQNGSQDPFEMVNPPNVGERVVVVKASGDPRFLHIDTIRGQLEINTDGNITGHAAATNAFACAAVDIHTAYPNAFSAANPVEDFSTDGPRRVFYNADGTPITPGNFLASGGNVRQKPDIAAADGVSTTLPSFTGLNPFYGTSAAAPHAAAIAALLKSYNPTLTQGSIRSVFSSTALDNEAPGFDVNAGAGIVMAYQALAAVPSLPIPNLVLVTNVVFGGNGNGIVEFDECNSLNVVLANIGNANATGVRAVLLTTNAEVAIAQSTSVYPNIPIGASGTNLMAFKVSTSPAFVCGTPIDFSLIWISDQATSVLTFRIPTGLPGSPLRFDNNTMVPIPSPGSASSTILVSNVSFAVNKVTVSTFVEESFDYFLTLELIAPDGTTNVLSANNGFGSNYGLACSPEAQRTTFDDAALTPIASGLPPFVGSYQPTTPLSVWIGKSGTNINGTWQLRATDMSGFDVAAIHCWSLFITPTLCVDGGGECPGADLSIGLSALPNPVIAGNSLTYTISVVNNGPATTTNVTITHIVPSTALFLSASSSQGTYSQSPGVVTFNLGRLGPRGAANMTVTVLPTIAGTLASTATVTSEQPDFVPSNNSATVQTQVTPPTADLAVSIASAPNPTLVGNTLTYTVTLTNNGPSPSTGITVTNLLPGSATILTPTGTRGSFTKVGNIVFWSLSGLASGAGAAATVPVVPMAEGTIRATSTAAGAEFDPIAANSTASIDTVVGPAADVAVGLSENPNPVVAGSNALYVVAVTNFGPSVATGVIVNDALSPSVSVVSTTPSQGTISISNSTVIWNVGTLSPGSKASASITAATTTNATISSTATVIAAQPDPHLSNNSTSISTVVASPFISVVAAGAVLTSESGPVNGAVDIGETVTVILRLRDAGNISTRNLVATLLPGDGVAPVPPNNPQAYGILFPSGFAVGRPFSFTASGANGGAVTATLSLQDGTNTYSPIRFTFNLPNTRVFTNPAAIAIPDLAAPNEFGPGKPYPSIITVPGITGVLGRVSVTLSNLTHSYPGDVNVLLVSSNGVKTLLMSHAGDQPVSGLDLTFDDFASSPLPDSGQLASGVWQPAAYGVTPTFPANAPAGPYNTALASFNSVNPQGPWSLYVYDDAGGDRGDLTGGWSLALTMLSPVNLVADLALSAAAAPNPILAGDTLTYTFNITNHGPDTASSVAFTNILPAGVTLLSVTPSQGIFATNGTSVVASLGTLASGTNATVTVVVTPTAAAIPLGLTNIILTSTASVVAGETDVNLINNSASVVTTVYRPVAELALAQTVAPDPVVVGQALTNLVAVTNFGPNNALGAVLTQRLPAGVGFLAASSSSTVGTLSNIAGMVTCALGDLGSNATATVIIVLTNSAPGLMTNAVSISSGSLDPSTNNNASTYIATVVNPTPQIINAGAVMTYESGPVNGAIDANETNTLSLALANIGSLDTVNLKATLVNSGGVTSLSSPKDYGSLVAGGPSAARSFTFKSPSALGGAVVVSLQLQDERPGVTNNLGTTTFAFASGTFSNVFTSAAIFIPDHGASTPYPSVINASGVTGRVSKVTLVLNGLSHAFPHDVNVLLVSPSGSNVLVMSHTGGGNAVTNITLTFDDAAEASLPNSERINSGTYKPTSYEGPITLPGTAGSQAYSTSLSGMKWSEPNGSWYLYVFDDATGDSGAILSGWSLGLTTLVTIGPVVDLAVGITAPATVDVGSVLATVINVTNVGPDSATGVVLTNVLPAGASFTSASLSQGGPISVANGRVTCNFGTIPAGGIAQATIRSTPSQSGSLLNLANVITSDEDLSMGNNSAQATTWANGPAILSGAISNGYFKLTVTAQPNLVYVVQGSTNLVSWVSLSTNTNVTGTFTYTDTNSTTIQRRFYRTQAR